MSFKYRVLDLVIDADDVREFVDMLHEKGFPRNGNYRLELVGE